MAEFLYRGYNVAVPAVDVGDDVYIVEDQAGIMWRLQVKTADQRIDDVACFQLSRQQLREIKANDLFYMFMTRWSDRWRFVLIDRKRLFKIRSAFEAADRSGRCGRRPVGDGEAATDALTLRIAWRGDDARGWGASFSCYLDCWPRMFPERSLGPGAVRSGARSPDPRTRSLRAPRATPRRVQ